MLVSQLLLGCDLRYWTTNSAVAVAESSAGPAGPYTFVDFAYNQFHTNPRMVGPTPDRYYLLFMVGTDNPGVRPTDCTQPPVDPPNSAAGRAAGQIVMGYSKSPAGPWSDTTRVILNNQDAPGYQPGQSGYSDWNCELSNPSALILPNGTVVVVFASLPCSGVNYGKYGTSMGMALAPHWNASYVQSPTPIWLKKGAAWPEPTATGVGNCEDPFLFTDSKGNFHIVSHSQGTLNICGGGEGNGNSCAIHFFSRSLWGPWLHSMTPVYTATVNVSIASGNGGAHTESRVMSNRQRPFIVFGEGAQAGVPRYLLNAGSFEGVAMDHTYAFEFV